MVAHRMAVVEAADRILRVEHGGVIEIPRAMVLP
jgi:ABC-type transport system involved in cytochrome bd biosynthesis fused ATPase/permease subunit